MACVYPILIQTPQGQVQVSCKQCLQCRIHRQSAIALRALLESRTTWSAEFWTLTYAQAPDALNYSDFSNFLKRFREWNVRKGNPRQIRYLCCGEYGTKSGRPHFHALIFNNHRLMKQETHTKLWPLGFVYTGTVTPASINYTARYCLKDHAKGQEPVAHWSKNPPLGEDGMRLLAAYERERRHARSTTLKTVPPFLRIENKNYYLDMTMKRIFRDEYEKLGDLMREGKFDARKQYLINKALGDPNDKNRERLERKAEFFQKAKLNNETL